MNDEEEEEEEEGDDEEEGDENEEEGEEDEEGEGEEEEEEKEENKNKNDNEEKKEGEEEKGEEEKKEEEVEDGEISWENLEVAKTAIIKYQTENPNEKTNFIINQMLSKVYLRLGDVNRFNGNYNQAILDYQCCLSIRNDIFKSHDRFTFKINIFVDSKIADIHYTLALVYLYKAADSDELDPEAQVN